MGGMLLFCSTGTPPLNTRDAAEAVKYTDSGLILEEEHLAFIERWNALIVLDDAGDLDPVN